MSFFTHFIDVFLHLDKYLTLVVQTYGSWTYGLLFVIVFCETGLVVTPFLPGDSLLFTAGALASIGNLQVVPLILLFLVAAILGDSVNYLIGRKVGLKVFHKNNRWFKYEHLERTQRFYAKYGAKAILFARFIPIIRTIAPFVAGVGSMHYRTFITYNVVSALLWVLLFVGGGYIFGNLPSVREHFGFVVLAIIVISCLPPMVEAWKARSKTR